MAVASDTQPETASAGSKTSYLDIVRARANDVRSMFSLPRLSIDLMLRDTVGNDPFYAAMVKNFHAECRSGHPKLPLLPRRVHGFATCVLPGTFDEYFMKIDASARRNYKKAGRLGYTFKRIDFNDHLDDISEIRSSATVRQGAMPDDLVSGHVKRCTNPPSIGNAHDYPYFGVFQDGKLFAYAGCIVAGELCEIEHIFGHADRQSDGVVPKLIVDTAQHLYEHFPLVSRYAYDMYFGAGTTLRRFKKKFRFDPYRVDWQLG